MRSRPIFTLALSLSCCLLLAKLFEIMPAGPDGVLYGRLAENLLNGRGYIDNLRHQEVLPPVGHPLLLAVFRWAGVSGGTLTFLLILSSVLLVFQTGFVVSRAWWAGLALAALYVYGCYRYFNIDGVEASILFLNTLLVWSMALALVRGKASWYLATGSIALASLLVRPSLIMAWGLLLVWTLIRTIEGKDFPGRAALWFFVPLAGGLAAVSGLSLGGFGDLRLLSGTYGAIPVYCAFNEHIDLKQPYHSELWRGLPEDKKREVQSLMDATSGWQHRERKLKAETYSFIRRHPAKALSAVFWRFKTYTWGNDRPSYKIFLIISLLSLLYLWIIPSPADTKLRVLAFLSFAMGIWILFMKLFFVYTDNRYTVDMIPFFLMPPAILLGKVSRLVPVWLEHDRETNKVSA